MSNFLLVKRQGNGDLQYCVPRAIARHQASQEKTQRTWRLGPWQRLTLRHAFIPPLHICEHRVSYHAHAPFRSNVLDGSPLPTPPTYASSTDKQKLHVLNENAKMKKVRYSAVLPVVALSKNGEWVPPALGRKIHARLPRHCSGAGWSKRCISSPDGAQLKTETVGLACIDDDRQQFSLNEPEWNSSALLLQKLCIAEEELKRTQHSIRRPLVHTGSCDSQGRHHHVSTGSNGATSQHGGRGTQSHHGAPNAGKVSVRASCLARRKKSMLSRVSI